MELTNEQKRIITNTYHKYFKDSAIKFSEYKDSYYMWIRFYLAKDETELFNTYWDNDVFKIDFEIDKVAEDSYCLKTICSKYIIKPANDYHWCDYKNVSFRKTKGDFNKIVESLERYFKRLHDQFMNDYDNDNLHSESYKKCMFSGNNVAHRYIASKHLVREVM